MIVETPITPADIEPGMLIRRRIVRHGIIRTDELVCAQNEHGVIVNPRGYRIPHEGSDWYALGTHGDSLTKLIDLLFKASVSDPEVPVDDPVKLSRQTEGTRKLIRAEADLDAGMHLDEICQSVGITKGGLYKSCKRHQRLDLWKRLREAA